MNVNNSMIIGAATGYTPNRVAVFLNSLNSVGFSGTVVLLIYKNDLDTYQDFYAHSNFGFKLVYHISQIGLARRVRWYRTFKPIINFVLGKWFNNNSAKKYQLLKKFAYPHVSRFFEFHEYLLNSPEISFAMLTDTRDVFFQQHPFLNVTKGLYLGIENPNVPMEQDKTYSCSWILDVYGEQVLNEISSNPICCAGVTLGDYESVMQYLNVMIQEFLSLPYSTMAKSNYDQGIHNRLLYANQFRNVQYCLPLDSIISTVGLLNESDLNFNSDNELLLNNGLKATIIHQYDRYENWDAKIKQRFYLSNYKE